MADVYFSGQGKVYLGTRNSDGTFNAPLFVGNVPSLSVNLDTDVVEHKESTTGKRLPDLRLTREQRATVQMTLEDINSDNLALMLHGTKRTIASSAVTNEAMPTAMAVGSLYKAAQEGLSAISVVDSAGTPATLVLNTHYKVVDAAFGLIEILNIASFVQPFKINYTYAARTQVPIFDAAATERYIRYHGLNTANTNKKVLVEIYRVLFDPAQNMQLINDDVAQWEMTGSCLYDASREGTTALGPFGRFSYVDAQ